MNLKKKITTFILIAFGILQFQPIFAKTFEIEEGTLQEFLKTTEDIKVAYNWTQVNTNRSLGQTIILPAGTPITIRSLSTIKSSEIKSGDIVKFTVNSDVKNREGYTIIKAGADVSAEIVFSKEKGKIGKSGILKISNFHTRAVDGSYIPLSATLSSEPEDNMVTSILLSVLSC